MTLWPRLLAAGLVVGGLAWGAHALVERGDRAGYARANAEWEKKEQSIEDQAAAKYDQSRADSQQRAADLQNSLNGLEVTRYQEKNDAAKSLEKAVAAAVARTERLSIRTSASCPVPGGNASADPRAAGGLGSEARTDLLPETAAAIFGIAADSAGLVRDYNDVVKRYNLARIACNTK